jgi:hypothetical protein
MTRYLNDDSDFEIVNGKKVLKDNRTYRAKMVLMDAAPDNQRRSRIVDAAQPGDPYGTHRPGYRVFDVDDTGGRKAIADAHEAYLFDLENAWRGDAASNPTKDPDLNDPDDDEDDNERPRLRRRFQKRDPFGHESGSISEEDGDRYQARYADNDAAVLQDRAPAHLARVHDGTGDNGLAMHRPGFRISDATLSDELQRAYDAYEHQLSTAWRRDAGNDCAVPVSPRASGNDATPVGDIETAYRLYSEEISQAWKTPR